MDESLEKWERWLEQSLKLDTGYQKIRVSASPSLKEDVSVRRLGDVFEVEILAALRDEPERFGDAYEQVLREIINRAEDATE